MKELVYLLHLRKEKINGDEAFDSRLRALSFPIKNVDVDKPSKYLDEDVTKDESYDEP